MPVGLFGLQTKISRVCSVIAAAIASKSCASSSVSGTCTARARPTWVTIGYASNDRHANITSSVSAPQVIWTSSWHSATLPQPTAIVRDLDAVELRDGRAQFADWLSG